MLRLPHLRGRALAAAALAALAIAGAPACKSSGKETSRVQNGQNSRGQADRYVRKAVRRSPEGFIVMPSKKAERAFDRVRLGDLAQQLRAPAAACFINRAIETIEPGDPASDEPFRGVPEGQAKLRVRIAPTGEVLRVEVLETGFDDEPIEQCLIGVLEGAKWPKNRSGNTHWIDVIYWVSLGVGEEDQSIEARTTLRREQALAAVRAKGCFTGRVRAGTYALKGLSLLDREGNTLVNRVEPSEVPQEVADCVALTFRQIRMPRAPEAFVRPFWTAAEFTVASDGGITFADERWLSLILMEEEAEREARRAELAGGVPAGRPPTPEDLVDLGEPEPDPEGEGAPASEPGPVAVEGAAGRPAGEGEAPAKESGPRGDPGKGGLKLKLGTRPSG
ncbi:MAG: hypothetical protein KC420_12585 [Myxococcales bacterium]|nr:hypothetical protein [Myxococcales bacterium]MCB9568435.1 hypothetical protein [Myxococcales bacterium]MCB9702078.1 hypothetical protein [Myxococcales bacterium]